MGAGFRPDVGVGTVAALQAAGRFIRDSQPDGLSRIHMYSLLNDILLIHYLCSEASARQVVGPRPEFALEGTLACSRYGVFERAIADGPTA